MPTPPSPSSSPSLTLNDPSSRKRLRSESMDSEPSSSSKRSISVDPSLETLSAHQSYDLASLSMTDSTIDADIDAYMADQGEASIPSTLDESTQQMSDSAATVNSFTSEQRLALVDGLCGHPMVPGATWYLVSRRWYKRWRKACSGEVDKEGPVTEAELGPVDNSPLVDNLGNLTAPPVEKVDVEFVPESAWGHFVAWYGQPQWPLPRQVITRGYMNEASLEIMPPHLRVHLVAGEETQGDLQRPVHVTMSSKDTVKALVTTLSNAVRVSDSDMPTRVWKLPEGDDFATLEYPVSKLREAGAKLLDVDERTTLDDALINSGDAFVVEIRTRRGWLVPDSDPPTQASGASTPQSISSNATPNKLFGRSNFFDQLQSKSSPPSTDVVKSDVNGFKPASTYNKSAFYKAKASRIDPGTLGLGNMGNTCFMNSAIQCLAHTQELMDYFLLGVFEDELNPENPLGMHGAIAEAFGSLLRRIWDPVSSGTSYSPRDFKQVLQKFAPQFGGYQQHDSQELVAFLLDGLHEDLNRVLKKPYVEKPDWEGGGDKELVALARESWDGYMKRNDSVIVDLFQGQYQSTLVCPECEKVSITFDPFMYLTLPLPIQKKWSHDVFYIPWDVSKPHVKVSVELNRDASFKDVRQLLGRWMDANPDHLLTLEIFNNRFYKDLNDNVAWGDMLDNDLIVCYEVPIPPNQSRPLKRKDGDPFLIPVFMCDTLRPTRHSYSSNTGVFGYPFLISVTEEEASDKDAMYNLVVSRLERWTENARELSTWEAGSPSSSLDGSFEEVPIPIAGDTLADSMVEITENGDVIAVRTVPAEEDDIVDQKHTVIRESEEETEAHDVTDSPPRKVGFKKDIFQLHIHPFTTAYGVGFGSLGPSRSLLASWETREEEAKDSSSSVLLRPNDVFVCEFDSHMKAFYFGESAKWEHAKWDQWDQFVHPELQATRDAAKAQKKKSISLQDCLDEFTKEEKLGEDDLWYCPQCKKHQQATKRFDLWKVPDVLVVHLKRFSNSRTLRDKIDAFVDFPLEGLDLTPMVGERKAAKRLLDTGADIHSLGLEDVQEPLVYDLYAVDEHLGGLGGGHYRAYAHNHATEKWYHFDDSYVTPAQPESAVNSNAYLLFYKRRTTRPLGGKSHGMVEAARQRPKAQSAVTETSLDDTQLPTPQSIALPGTNDIDNNWLTPLDSGTRSSSASRGSSPPPLDDAELPSFDDAALDPLILSGRRYDDGIQHPSPTSSLDAELDSDDPSSLPGTLHKHKTLWSSHPPRTRTADADVTDDEMD